MGNELAYFQERSKSPIKHKSYVVLAFSSQWERDGSVQLIRVVRWLDLISLGIRSSIVSTRRVWWTENAGFIATIGISCWHLCCFSQIRVVRLSHYKKLIFQRYRINAIIVYLNSSDLRLNVVFYYTDDDGCIIKVTLMPCNVNFFWIHFMQFDFVWLREAIICWGDYCSFLNADNKE